MISLWFDLGLRLGSTSLEPITLIVTPTRQLIVLSPENNFTDFI